MHRHWSLAALIAKASRLDVCRLNSFFGVQGSSIYASGTRSERLRGRFTKQRSEGSEMRHMSIPWTTTHHNIDCDVHPS
jgi:hypothetical protein